jgi:hypothetical protein
MVNLSEPEPEPELSIEPRVSTDSRKLVGEFNSLSKAEKRRALAKGQGEDGELVKTSTAQLEAEKAQLEAELEARKRNKSSAVEQAETPQPEPEPEQEPEATVGVTRPASPVREAARQEVCGDEVAFDDGDRDTSDSQPMLFQ